MNSAAPLPHYRLCVGWGLGSVFRRLREAHDILEDVMYRVEWDRLRVCNVDWSRFSNARLTLRWAYIGQEARVRGTGYAVNGLPLFHLWDCI
jgi:hypothetical protein